MNNKILIFLASAFLLFSLSCSEKKETEGQVQRTDSLSIKLNSPELKAVNTELLESPDDAALYNKRAKIYFSLKQFPEAVHDSKRAVKLDSTKAEYYLTLIDTYFSQNNTRLAKELLEITAKKFPDNIEALLKLSELYFLVKQYQNAIDFVNKALKIDENLARAYYIKGSIYRESGDTARAVSSLETAIEQDNKYVDAFYDLGVIYAARKNPLALEYYNNVLRINPAHEDVAYARAKLLQDLGKIDEAVKEYENIIGKKKDCYNCYYNLGAIYFGFKKDFTKAIEQFTKAIELNPNYIEAYFARGYIYELLKDKESARADYKMCLQIQSNYEPAIQELNNL
jgi:tetratricopeptide (TPR) repeat protein